MEQLGAWILERHLASGGQGQVLAARHAATGRPAAIKRLRSLVEERHLLAFRREMRTIAALDHPRIVQILDVGDEGEPWIAMELATGTLRTVGDWTSVVRATAAVLEALAHAHGRGLLHLDVKPANVLLGCPEEVDEAGDDAPPGLRLSDFGLSHDLRATGPTRGRAVGTPGFMSPEQIRGERGRYGPETDLYAVGALVWELCAGRPPFVGATQDVLRAQLRGTLPPLVPRFAVPDLLAEWLGWCLAPSPSLRPQRAADLLLALRALGDETGAPVRVSRPSARDSGATTMDLDALEDATLREGEHGLRWPRATAPATWRRPEAWKRTRPLADGGLAMVGLRQPRLVGREAERDRLWEALRSVQVDREGVGGVRPRVVVLRGVPGAGASMLAGWLAERAHESGAAHVLRVHHAEPRGEDDGLEAAITRWGHLRGLEGGDLEDRLADVLRSLLVDPEPWVVRNLAAWLDGRSAIQPAALAVSLCGAWNERPLLLAVDDASCGPETLAFVEALLAQAELVPLRVMAVLVAGEGPSLGRVEALQARPDVDTITLGPLAPVDVELLLREWVGLAPALADRLTAESGGLPGDALALVAALRARGRLVPGPRGLELPPGADLVETDTGPLQTASEALGHDEDALRWLEAAAIAGDRVELAPEVLLELGLLRVDAGGEVVFASPDLRRALIRRATEGGRLAGWHLRAAEREDLPPERAGRHLLAGGRPDLAVDPLLTGAEVVLTRRALAEALELAELAGRALAEAGIPVADPRWSQQRVLRMTVTSMRGYSPALVALVEASLAEAEAHGWPTLRARALELRGWCRHIGGDDQAGIADAEEAERAWEALGDATSVARAQVNHALYELSSGRVERAVALALGAVATLEGSGQTEIAARVAAANALQRAGRWDEAGDQLDRARAIAEAGEERIGLARTSRQLAVLRCQQGRYAEALALAREATELARRDGTWMGMAHGHSLTSDALRGLGRLEEATVEALAALDLYVRLEAEPEVPTTNLAILHLLRGDDAAALERAEQVVARHSSLLRSLAGLVRVAALIGLGREEEARAAWPEVERTLLDVREVEADLTLLRAEVARRAPWISDSAG
ncbi:MAG: serine/threonine protein kinase [Alphaproteobacteria bacterium]|nr:serine/threonine protein kinase [Alphaproteobacteria bacterium]MCB9696179.1 serine/threonine protein kinase [Alphaproteobacteria bacterium]